MRRRLIVACLALLIAASMVPLPSPASRACCCKAASCPMHQKHDGSGCRIDRCGGSEDAAAMAPATIRAVLVSTTLPQPDVRERAFPPAFSTPCTRAVPPAEPPPWA